MSVTQKMRRHVNRDFRNKELNAGDMIDSLTGKMSSETPYPAKAKFAKKKDRTYEVILMFGGLYPLHNPATKRAEERDQIGRTRHRSCCH